MNRENEEGEDEQVRKESGDREEFPWTQAESLQSLLLCLLAIRGGGDGELGVKSSPGGPTQSMST